MKRFTYLLFSNILLAIVLLAILEGSARLILPAEEINSVFNDKQLRTRGRPFVEYNPKFGFALKKNHSDELYHINTHGFRNKELPENLNTDYYPILSLGESTTFGWMVRDVETYPHYLMQLLTENSVRFENKTPYVINAGIPSFTSSQARLYFDDILSKNTVKPKMILLNIMWNDIWYSSVKNWHPDILIYQRPPQWISWLTENSRLVHWALMGRKTSEQLVDIENTSALEMYADNLRSIIETAKEQQIKVIFIEPPFDIDHMPELGLNEFHVRYTKDFFILQAMKYRATMQAVANKNGVLVINHRLSLDHLHQKSLFIDLLHPVPEGNKKMAEDIFEKMTTPTNTTSVY